MASSSLLVAYTLCILCICNLQGTVLAVAKSSWCIEIYTHEIRGGPNKTVLLAAGTNEGGSFYNGTWGSVFVFDNMIYAGPSPASQRLGRGSVFVFDNMIYAGPSPASQRLGRVTGTTILTTKGAGFPPGQFIAQFLFEAGNYNGSSLTVLPGFIVGTAGQFEGYLGSGYPVEVPVVPPEPLHVFLWTVCLSKAQQ